MHLHSPIITTTATSITLATFIALAPPAAAQTTTHWTAPGGGSFNDPANWDAGAPDADTIAVINPGSDDGEIDITFDRSAAAHQLFIHSGDIAFLLNDASLWLNAPFVWNPSLFIAAETGDTASLSLINGDMLGSFAVVGDEAGAYGSLHLDNASLDLAGHAWLGLAGEGALELTNNSTLHSVGATIGSLAGSHGEAIITGGAHWQTTGHARLSQLVGSTSSVSITGEDASWIITGNLDVGMRDTGTLTISDGAAVTVGGSAYVGTFKNPAFPGGLLPPVPHGVLEIIGPGSAIIVAGDLWVSPPTLAAPFNVGRLTLDHGGRAIVNGKLHQGGPVQIILRTGEHYSANAAIEAATADFAFPDAPHITILFGEDYTPAAGDMFRLITLPANQTPLLLPTVPPPLVKTVLDVFGETRLYITEFPDLTGDGVVNVFDLLTLLAHWGPCDPDETPGPQKCPGDINLDGVVDVIDLLLLLANWG